MNNEIYEIDKIANLFNISQFRLIEIINQHKLGVTIGHFGTAFLDRESLKELLDLSGKRGN